MTRTVADMAGTRMDELVAAHGPVLRASAGVPRWVLRALAERDELAAVLPGVFVPWALRADPEVLMTAVAAWNPNAVLCGAAAARLTYWPTAPLSVIEVASPTRIVRPGFRFLRSTVPREHLMRSGELLTMTPALAAVHLAVSLGGRALDEALRAGVQLAELHDALAAIRSWTGNRRRAVLLRRSRSHPWSDPERELHDLLDARQIGGWVAKLQQTAHSGEKYFLDIAFRAVRLAVEIDSWQYHGGPSDMVAERLRQNDLVESGWTFLRYTPFTLETDPAGLIAQIERRLVRLRRGR